MVVKLFRSITLPIAGFAAMALLSGCGDSTSLTGPELDTTPPPAPTDLTFSRDAAGQAVLTWTDSSAPDVAGYQVYVYSALPGGGNGFVPASDPNGTDNSYTLPSSVELDSPIYRVRAVDTSGNQSAFSSDAAFPGLPVEGSQPHDPIEIH